VNRFKRWRKAGVRDRLLQAVSKAYDDDIQMIDFSSIRVHQHAANGQKRAISLHGSLARRLSMPMASRSPLNSAKDAKPPICSALYKPGISSWRTAPTIVTAWRQSLEQRGAWGNFRLIPHRKTGPHSRLRSTASALRLDFEAGAWQ
jgi:hypothetical protein